MVSLKLQYIFFIGILVSSSIIEVSELSSQIENSQFQFTQKKTSAYGGSGGENFQWAIRESEFLLSEIRIRSGHWIDQISLVFEKGSQTLQSPVYGNGGGKYRAWKIPQGSEIRKVELTTTKKYVETLTFITNKEESSGKFGGKLQDLKTINIPDGYRIIGLYGKSKRYVDNLGFIIEKRTKIEEPENFQDCENLCKLPAYLGSGYDIFKGNPESQITFDPGFRSPIFSFTYKQRRKTQDNKYFIPDGAHSRVTQACSFSSKTKTFLGTESYQNQLKTKVSLSGGYNGGIASAAFSASVSYEHMESRTLNQQNIIIHTSSQCEAYRLTVGTFIDHPLEENFIQAVQYSYKNNNWTRFFGQFGTHIAYDITFGGSAIHHYEYSRERASILQSQSINIEAAAKFKYAQYYGDTSFDFSNNNRSASYSDKSISTSQQIYIGGKPQRKGDIDEWQKNVAQLPMPIIISLTSISEFFPRIFNEQDSEKASAQFQLEKEKYCISLNCSQTHLDKALQNAKFSKKKTASWGGNGGGIFDWFPVRLALSFSYISSVTIKSGRLIDSIKITMKDGVESESSGTYGGNGGGIKTWNVPEGSEITQVVLRTGSLVDSLQFITNKGIESPQFGGNGGDRRLFTVPKGWKLVGIYGKRGRLVDRIGFYIGYTTFS